MPTVVAPYINQTSITSFGMQMNFCEMRQDDISAVLKLRLFTRENWITMAELADQGITPESVSEALDLKTNGWVCEDEGRINFVVLCMADTLDMQRRQKKGAI